MIQSSWAHSYGQFRSFVRKRAVSHNSLPHRVTGLPPPTFPAPSIDAASFEEGLHWPQACPDFAPPTPIVNSVSCSGQNWLALGRRPLAGHCRSQLCVEWATVCPQLAKLLRHSAAALGMPLAARVKFRLPSPILHAAHLSQFSTPGPGLFPECFTSFYLLLVCTVCVVIRTTLLSGASCGALFPCPVCCPHGVYSGDLFPYPVCSLLGALSKHPVCCIPNIRTYVCG